MESRDLGGFTDADVFAERVGSEAAAAADVPVDVAFFVPFYELGADLGTYGGAV